MNTYQRFLESKRLRLRAEGFEPLWLPDCLMGFQRLLDDWAIRLGRAAMFCDCGMGKTLMQLVWAENVVRKVNGRVLVLTPLAVSQQTVREAEKFGIEARQTQDGKLHKGICVTNYERLKNYRPEDFAGVVCDESSILKNFDGKTRQEVTRFLEGIHYRLLCTATPAPNDFMELGCSAEAVGAMKRSRMLSMFFTNNGESTQQWQLKGHAKGRFWQWMASWARACRKPSDLGFPDDAFVLPKMHTVLRILPSPGQGGKGFFPRPAITLDEQRIECRRSLEARCDEAARVTPRKGSALLWCHYNAEGDLLTRLIPGAVQVSGADPHEEKEEKLNAFSTGQIRVLVTKPKIAGFGLNWQHCSQVVYFPSHSHEQYYQAIRRCWRFGQEKEVTCQLVATEALRRVTDNMLRKERHAEEMYAGVVREMGNALRAEEANGHIPMEIPQWLRSL